MQPSDSQRRALRQSLINGEATATQPKYAFGLNQLALFPPIKHKTSAARRRTAIRFSSRKGLQVLEKPKLDSVILGIRVRDSWMSGAWDSTSRPIEIALAAEMSSGRLKRSKIPSKRQC